MPYLLTLHFITSVMKTLHFEENEEGALLRGFPYHGNHDPIPP